MALMATKEGRGEERKQSSKKPPRPANRNYWNIYDKTDISKIRRRKLPPDHKWVYQLSLDCDSGIENTICIFEDPYEALALKDILDRLMVKIEGLLNEYRDQYHITDEEWHEYQEKYGEYNMDEDEVYKAKLERLYDQIKMLSRCDSSIDIHGLDWVSLYAVPMMMMRMRKRRDGDS